MGNKVAKFEDLIAWQKSPWVDL